MRLTVILALVLIVSSCSHTNELKHHSLKEKTVEYKYALVGDALTTPHEQRVEALFEREIGEGGNHVIASGVASKLHRLAKAELMVGSISVAMSEGVSTYLQLAINTSGASDYIFETVLEEYWLRCTEEGLMIDASVHCRLVERQSGKPVWDDRTSKKIYWTHVSTDGEQEVAVSCRELMTMSDMEIRRGLDAMASHIASAMIETMRQDVLELRD